MCGILAIYNHPGDEQEIRERALQLSKRIRHRGPDWSGCVVSNNTVLCHERLAIVGVVSGAQPLTNHDNTIFLSVNGEIYNHKALSRSLKSEHEFKTQSDCEVILFLYEEYGADFVHMLDGFFSFVLFDSNKNRIIAARDAVGITTLYHGYNSSLPNTVYFASELKALHDECDKIMAFPPGHIYDSEAAQITRWFQPTWWDENRVPTNEVDYKLLRETLERSVRKRLMAEVPYGVLLSGGLDSSLIASIAARETEKISCRQRARAQGEQASSSEEDIDESAPANWPRLHSFSIGLPGAPDLLAARDVAKFLNTIHHEFTFTVQEGLDAVSDVIYHLETYDVTTVRASTPMYLLSRRIKAMGVKMVLSGEGSDEIFGGYLYFHSAPDAKALHEETVSRVKNLHTSDCLRANKSTMAWGLEARVPFLDKDFLEVSMNVDPASKMSGPGIMEKYIIRKAFDVSVLPPGSKPYLPDKFLWRQKEQFSDGVGYSWIDSLKDVANSMVSDELFEKRAEVYPTDTPQTKEAFRYRQVFDHWFKEPACSESVVRWIPKAEWGCPSDPSGRAQSVHAAAYETK